MESTVQIVTSCDLTTLANMPIEIKLLHPFGILLHCTGPAMLTPFDIASDTLRRLTSQFGVVVLRGFQVWRSSLMAPSYLHKMSRHWPDCNISSSRILIGSLTIELNWNHVELICFRTGSYQETSSWKWRLILDESCIGHLELCWMWRRASHRGRRRCPCTGTGYSNSTTARVRKSITATSPGKSYTSYHANSSDLSQPVAQIHDHPLLSIISCLEFVYNWKLEPSSLTYTVTLLVVVQIHRVPMCIAASWMRGRRWNPLNWYSPCCEVRHQHGAAFQAFWSGGRVLLWSRSLWLFRWTLGQAQAYRCPPKHRWTHQQLHCMYMIVMYCK